MKIRTLIIIVLSTFVFFTLLAIAIIPIALEDSATHWVSKTIRQDIKQPNNTDVFYGNVNVDWRGRLVINNIVITIKNSKAPYSIKIDSITFSFSLWQWLKTKEYSIRKIVIHHPSILLPQGKMLTIKDFEKTSQTPSKYKRNEKKRYTFKVLEVTQGIVGTYDEKKAHITNLRETQAHKETIRAKNKSTQELYMLIVETILQSVPQANQENAR